MKTIQFFFLGIFFAAVFSCTPPVVEKIDVAVSILPQKFLVDEISANSLSVMVMIPPGQSPATYELTTRTARELAGAGLYLRIGHIMFERTQWQSILSVNSKMRMTDVSQGVNLIKSREHNAHENDHGHAHGEVDPHIWLSPVAMKIVVRNTCRALIKLKPEKKEMFTKNCKELIKKINKKDELLKKKLSPFKGKTIMVFHPAWTYFTRDYNFNQLAIESDGKQPGVSQMKKIIDTARKKGVISILIQKEFPKETARAIAADLNIPLVQVDPLAYNWFEIMDSILDAVTGK